MKKKIIVSLSAVLTAAIFFSSCNFEIISEETTLPDTLTEEQNVMGEVTFYEEKTTVQKPIEEETSTEEVTTAPTQEETTLIGELKGYTSKGFPITEKDGITYVDGVLVANKTYSLPESYDPGKLLPECENAFSEMQSAAAKEGLTLWNASGFRSYELQQSLYTRYSERDGSAAADRYSARPGHSEHQSGLAIDLNTITSAFADTKEGKWVAENCWKYGFILRYPKDKEDKTGYMYEAWHIRYVGTDVAEKIYTSGLCLEEYYGITSAYENNNAPATEEPALSEEVLNVTEQTDILPAETTLSATVETSAESLG